MATGRTLSTIYLPSLWLIMALGLLVVNGNQPETQTSLLGQKQSDKVFFCYYGSWATYNEEGAGKFDVEDIDPWLCTHVIYSFGVVRDNQLTSGDPELDLWDDGGQGAFSRFVALKEQNPSLKTMIAVGGWAEGSQVFSDMASEASSRSEFVQSAVEFLQTHGFDGLDVDWEFPNNRNGSRPEDRENFVSLLWELREAFNPFGYTLTAAVGTGKTIVDSAYEVERIVEPLDLINIMCYDFHGTWEPYAHHNAPLNRHPLDEGENEFLNVHFAVEYWLQLGAPKEKMVMGMPLYGTSFTLDQPWEENHEFYAPASEPGVDGPFGGSGGYLGFNEVCELQKTLGEDFVRFWSDEIQAPYAVYYDDQWVGYDDVESIQQKVNYLNEMGLRGAMVWSIENDDFDGDCQQGSFEDKRNPLMKTISNGVLGRTFKKSVA